jgi:hypothetical protein
LDAFMAVFDADVVCGIEPMQSALKHSCQLPSVRARTGFAATDDAVGVAGSLFGDSNGPEPGVVSPNRRNLSRQAIQPSSRAIGTAWSGYSQHCCHRGQSAA